MTSIRSGCCASPIAARPTDLPDPGRCGRTHAAPLTGDCLFPGGVGNTFGSAENFASLVDGVETKLFGTLPDETWVYPGHGDDTTIGAERPHLADWRARGW